MGYHIAQNRLLVCFSELPSGYILVGHVILVSAPQPQIYRFGTRRIIGNAVAFE
jgi:hypothetical protein